MALADLFGKYYTKFVILELLLFATHIPSEFVRPALVHLEGL